MEIPENLIENLLKMKKSKVILIKKWSIENAEWIEPRQQSMCFKESLVWPETIWKTMDEALVKLGFKASDYPTHAFT